MSTMPSEDDELYDPYEASGQASGVYAPTVSWKFARVGTDTARFTGVLVPPKPVERPTKGHVMRRDYQNGTDTDPDDKGWMVWPPKNNTENINRPVTEKKFRLTWPEESLADAQKVSQVNLSFATTYTNGEFLSDNTVKRMGERDQKVADQVLRRIIKTGADLRGKIDAAEKAVGGRPVPGQIWTIELTDRKDNAPKKGTTSIFTVTIEPPTPASLAIVEAYIVAEKEKAALAADAAAGDPYVSGAAPEDVPF